ncbi:MAG: asparaginase [Betaproteobacteria bacterium]|nr:asparaginase [Betaproteobacteria bacterium]
MPQAPLTVVTRGDAIESTHFGSVAVVDREGTLLYAAGDPFTLTFTRSALKPLQALPFVAADGHARFGFTQPELALLCASHSGEQHHVEAAAAILAKAGKAPADLQCGAHPPLTFEARGVPPPPPPYSPLAHNCSGKHGGMLACCVHWGHATGDYLVFDHPLQQAIRRAVARFTVLPEEDLISGVDGCSAPNYAMPLAHLALAYAKLVSPEPDADFGRAPKILADAMTAHPEMVSGDARSDLALARAGRGDWVAKIGAEGVQAVAIKSRGWGIAVKVADGSARGLHPATVAVLVQLDLLDGAGASGLAKWSSPTFRNHRGVVTGKGRGVVSLDRHDGAINVANNEVRK